MNDTQEIQVTIEQLREAVSLRDAITKLESNRAFKAVFIDDLFGKEPARLTSMLAEADQGNFTKEAIVDQLSAISMIQHHLHWTKLMGDNAERSIKAHEAELEAIRLEEDAD